MSKVQFSGLRGKIETLKKAALGCRGESWMKITKIVAILCIFTSLALAQDKQRIAVYMAGAEPHGALGSHKMVAGELVREISRSREYSAIDRTDAILAQLAKEHGHQRSGAVDDAQIKALGRQFGVNFLCIVEISAVQGGTFYLDVRLVNVETAEAVKSATAISDLGDGNEMMQVAQYLARELVGESNGARYTQKPRDRPIQQAPPPPPVVQHQTWESQQAEPAWETQSPPPSYSHPVTAGNTIAGYVFGIENAVLGENLAEAIVNGLVNSRKYSAPRRGTREFYRMADREQAKIRGRMLDDRSFCRIGSNFGVHYLVIVDIEKAGRGNSVWARIIDLNTCRVIANGESTALIRNDAEVRTVANELVNELLSRRIHNRGYRR